MRKSRVLSSILNQNHIVMSFHRLRSIVLPHLRPRISIPRGDIIARILLQRIGLRLRALRIELLAKLAFPLRCLRSFLVMREHGQLLVLLLETLSTEPVVSSQLRLPHLDLSHPSSRDHFLGRMLPWLAVAGLRGVSVCTHLSSFRGGVSGRRTTTISL
jgi:hypothetical protein